MLHFIKIQLEISETSCCQREVQSDQKTSLEHGT